jgi:hypothetical protein
MTLSDELTFALEQLSATTDGDTVEVVRKKSKYFGFAGVVTRYTKKMAYVTLVDAQQITKEVRLSKTSIRKIDSTATSLEEAVLEQIPEVTDILNALTAILASARLKQAPLIEALLRSKLLNAATELEKTKGPFFDLSGAFNSAAMVDTTL